MATTAGEIDRFGLVKFLGGGSEEEAVDIESKDATSYTLSLSGTELPDALNFMIIGYDQKNRGKTVASADLTFEGGVEHSDLLLLHLKYHPEA